MTSCRERERGYRLNAGAVYRFPFAIPELQITCLSSACLSLFAIQDAEFLRALGGGAVGEMPFSKSIHFISKICFLNEFKA